MATSVSQRSADDERQQAQGRRARAPRAPRPAARAGRPRSAATSASPQQAASATWYSQYPEKSAGATKVTNAVPSAPPAESSR